MNRHTQGIFAEKSLQNYRPSGQANQNTTIMLVVNLVAIAAILTASVATLSLALAA